MIQKITDLILQPYRPTYNPLVDLGPPSFVIDKEHIGSREDFEVVNRRGLTLQCSLFQREMDPSKKYPLMIYCHGNTGNRTSSYQAVYAMLRSKINVLTFDFAGCGLSEGDMISYGFFEQNDIADVLAHALKTYKFIDTSRIGIWGRCMGAVSGIMYSARSNHISLLILDTPFPDFPSLIRDYVQRVKIIPQWAEDYIYNNVKQKIKKLANFDIADVSPVSHLHKLQIPAFFVHGNQDAIVPQHLFKRVLNNYPAQKEYIELETSHNDGRPDYVYEEITKFVKDRFFSSQAYRSFDPSPRKMPPKPTPHAGGSHSLLTLGSIKFNEHTENITDEMANPYVKAIGKAGRKLSQDFPEIAGGNKRKDGRVLSKKLSTETKDLAQLILEERKGNLDIIEEHTPNDHSFNANFTDRLKVVDIKPMFDNKRSQSMRIVRVDLDEESDISDELLLQDAISGKDVINTSYIFSAARSTFDSFRTNKIRYLNGSLTPKDISSKPPSFIGATK